VALLAIPLILLMLMPGWRSYWAILILMLMAPLFLLGPGSLQAVCLLGICKLPTYQGDIMVSGIAAMIWGPVLAAALFKALLLWAFERQRPARSTLGRGKKSA
jgi:hypothetical protein